MKRKKILVIKPDDIGDAIILIPFLKELRRQRPEHFIFYASRAKTLSLIRSWPWVDKALPYSTDNREYSLLGKIYVVFTSGIWILQNRFLFCDEVYVMRLHASFPEKILAQLTFARKRIGWPNFGWPGLYTRPISKQIGLHESEQFCTALPQAVKKYPDCHFPCTSEESNSTKHQFPLGSRILAIGANKTLDEHRNWPISYYAEFIEYLHQQNPDLFFVLLGGKDDISSNDEIIKSTGDHVYSSAGKCTLLESYALLQRCYMFVGNDSGPMHLAAAARLPVIEVSGYPEGADISHANSPERFGPFGVPFRVCRPPKNATGDTTRKKDRIQEVSVSKVIDSYEDLCKDLGNVHV